MRNIPNRSDGYTDEGFINDLLEWAKEAQAERDKLGRKIKGLKNAAKHANNEKVKARQEIEKLQKTITFYEKVLDEHVHPRYWMRGR